MSDFLTLLLRIAGAGLILLAILHIPIGRHLKWREDAAKMSLLSESVFHVHTFFICVLLVIMGLPCLLEPSVFTETSRAGMWMTWSYCGFWLLRLYCQWFVYKPELWRGKRFETAMHWWFTFVWAGLTTLFAMCGFWQAGWRP